MSVTIPPTEMTCLETAIREVIGAIAKESFEVHREMNFGPNSVVSYSDAITEECYWPHLDNKGWDMLLSYSPPDNELTVFVDVHSDSDPNVFKRNLTLANYRKRQLETLLDLARIEEKHIDEDLPIEFELSLAIRDQEHLEDVVRLIQGLGELGSNPTIITDRYVTGKELGRGAWGIVYAAYDLELDEDVAIKVFSPSGKSPEKMLERQLTEFAVMKKEAGRLVAAGHIAPRRFEYDETGKPFIVMAKYPRFLSDVLQDDHGRVYLGNGLSMDEVLHYVMGIVAGVDEAHRKYKRIHGDVKPDNIALTSDHYVELTDLGTSTTIASENPKDNVGGRYIRSPHLFAEGSSLTESSDVFSVGSILYRMLNGSYIFEHEIKAVDGDPARFIAQFQDAAGRLDEEKIVFAIDAKLDKLDLPHALYVFLRNALLERYDNGAAMRTDFESPWQSESYQQWRSRH